MTEATAWTAMIEQGLAQVKEGQYEDAIETFSACHAIEGADDQALRGRGFAYLQLGKPGLAEPDFRAARDRNAGEPENHTGLALSLAMQNKIYEAIQIYEKLVAERPAYVPAYLQLAQLQLKIGAINKGREYLTEALKHRPSLAQRRTIETLVKEQDALDKNRYYRPDWNKLANPSGGPSFITLVIQKFLTFFNGEKK